MSHDVIVLGLGGMGSAAAYHLSGRGEKVLGLERFGSAHEMGSSHGRSRIIRQAYFEDPAYVPLLLRAYELWEDLERKSGEDLMNLTGALMVGHPESGLVSGSVRSAKEHGLPVEMLDARELRHRFPMLAPGSEDVALFEKRAGFVRPEASVKAHLDLAAQRGAELRFEEPVVSWEASENGVRVETEVGKYEAERLVVSVGAWSPRLLADLGLPLEVERHVMCWFEPREDADAFSPECFPVFIWEPEDGRIFYGVPDGPGVVKASFHHAHGTACTPETLDREVGEEESSRVRERLAEHVPALAGRCVEAKACMYTNTPDLHFVISAHPKHANVAIAAGFSGHGYKFCSVVGEILADLITEGGTPHPIDLFSPERLRRAK